MTEIKYGKRPIKLTRAKMDDFLTYLREMPNVSRAAKLCGFTGAGAFYEKRKVDLDFAEAWEDALQEGISGLEASAWNRAQDKSDILAMFLLKAHKPEMYMDRKDVTSGGKPIEGMSPVTIVEVVLPSSAPVENLHQAAEELVGEKLPEVPEWMVDGLEVEIDLKDLSQTDGDETDGD